MNFSLKVLKIAKVWHSKKENRIPMFRCMVLEKHHSLVTNVCCCQSVLFWLPYIHGMLQVLRYVDCSLFVVMLIVVCHYVVSLLHSFLSVFS